MVNERSFIMTHNGTRDTKERIREAAIRVFAHEGFDRASVKSIAAEAGVAVGSIYNHFADKDDLLISIFEEEFNARLSFIDELRSGSGPVLSQIEALIEAHFRKVRQYPELAELLLYERFHPGGRLQERIIPLQRRIVERIEEILRTGIDAGWIRPCHPKVVAQALFDLVQTMTACRVLAEGSDAEDALAVAPKELADLMWKGLRRTDDD